MSSLRKVTKEESGDVEAQPLTTTNDTDAPTNATSAFSNSSTSDSISPGPGGSTHNPVFLAKVIFKKVVSLLVSSDEEDITQPGGVVTLLKDIILGVILGVLTISTLIFLDHRDVVHFQSAHNFRNAAFQLLNDPETLKNIEESSDLKFMTMNDYTTKMKEIESVSEKIKGHEEVLAKRISEGEEKAKEVEGIKEEYNKLMSHPILGLDKYCGGCSWSGRTTCDGRVQFLQDTYNTRPIAAKINAMNHASCKKE